MDGQAHHADPHRAADVQTLLSQEHKKQDVLMHVLNLGPKSAPDHPSAQTQHGTTRLNDEIPAKNCANGLEVMLHESQGTEMLRTNSTGRDSNFSGALFTSVKNSQSSSLSMEEIICYSVRKVQIVLHAFAFMRL
jgi:hypothetical protein